MLLGHENSSAALHTCPTARHVAGAARPGGAPDRRDGLAGRGDPRRPAEAVCAAFAPRSPPPDAHAFAAVLAEVALALRRGARRRRGAVRAGATPIRKVNTNWICPSRAAAEDFGVRLRHTRTHRLCGRHSAATNVGLIALMNIMNAHDSTTRKESLLVKIPIPVPSESPVQLAQLVQRCAALESDGNVWTLASGSS